MSIAADNPESSDKKSDALKVSKWSIASRKFFPWVVVLAVLAFGVYMLKFRRTPVMSHVVALGEVFSEVMGTGTLEARVKTTISPRIQERLAEVLVDQGDSVQTGQLLARLDSAESQQLVAIAEANLAAARATVERVRAEESRAQAVFQQAQLNHQRMTNLIATQVAAQSDFDTAVESLHVSEADLKRSQAMIVEAQSQVFTAEKNLLYREEQMTFTEVRSPFDGLITRRDRDPGGIVIPGSSILQLVSTNEIWISAWVDETAMMGLKVDQPARVVFRSEPAKSYSGKVARLGREADRESREFVVDVHVKKQLPESWTIGQRAEVFIETGRIHDTLTVPTRYLNWSDGESGVFVENEGKATWRDLKLGLQGRETVEVIEGLKVGETVVAPSELKQPQLKPGQRIAI